MAALVSDFARGFATDPAIERADRARDDAAFRSAVAAALDGITAGQLAAAGYGLPACSRLGEVG